MNILHLFFSYITSDMLNNNKKKQFTCSFHFSHRAVSSSLWPHESHFTRLPCPSPTPGVHKNICSLRRWCHPAISSSVIPFSLWSKSLPSSEIFMSQHFLWGGQCTGGSALASVLPKNTQDWSPEGWTGGICLQSKGLSRVFSKTIVQKHQFFLALSFLHSPNLTSIYDHWKNHSLGLMDFRWQSNVSALWNTCIPVADSFWYLAKLIQLCKV